MGGADGEHGRHTPDQPRALPNILRHQRICDDADGADCQSGHRHLCNLEFVARHLVFFDKGLYERQRREQCLSGRE